MNEKVLKKIIPAALSAAFVLGTLPSMAACAAPAAQVQAKTWDFSQSLENWKYAGKWAYKGKPTVTYAKNVGKGALQLNVDYTKTAEEGWSEVKLTDGSITEKTPLDLTGYNMVTFDFYYNPANKSKGAFKTKLYMKKPDGSDISACPDIDLSKAQDAGNGLKKVTVRVPFQAVSVKIIDFEISIVGSSTDYKGDIYVDHIVLGYDDGYVQRTVQPVQQQKIDWKSLSLPSAVGLTDAKAIEPAAKLYAYMQGLAASGKVMYGHQNDLLMKAGQGASDSDTKDMLGDYPAVIEIDAMTLAGNRTEYQGHEAAAKALPPVSGDAAIARAVEATQKACRYGAIPVLSAHMPNFDFVAKKGQSNGIYDYSGFTSVVTTGDVVQRILPGGDLNEIYRGYLDKIAAYALQLQAKKIPVLFRPFHENNGSWFWWGAAHCSASQFKNLFRYTEEYLRDEKGVHNFLYVYSPNGPLTTEEDYLKRYPGDAFIDIPGFDMYQENPQKKDNWLDSFNVSLDVMQAFGEKHHKLVTVPEAGILCGKDTLGRTGAQRKEWYSEVLGALAQHKMSYFLSWSNFNADVFDQPYMVDKKRGHEMVDGFTRFYNDPRSVFAGQMADYTKIPVKTNPAVQTYGYLTAPNSNDRVCAPITVTAKAAGIYQTVQFAYKNAAGEAVAVIDGRKTAAGDWAAPLSTDTLAALGRTVGTIELRLDGQTADALRVFFNMPQTKAPIDEVDDFESYYGDNELLQGAYSTNCGPGCAILPAVSKAAGEHKDGDYGLAFHYKISKGGWAGIIKSMNGTDWSDYDAVQFWLVPDGKAQKLIIQINTNGEDFEVNLTELAKQTTPQLVTIPFTDFKGKQDGKFDKSHIQHFAIYCNTIGDNPVDSTFYFDDIKAVRP